MPKCILRTSRGSGIMHRARQTLGARYMREKTGTRRAAANRCPEKRRQNIQKKHSTPTQWETAVKKRSCLEPIAIHYRTRTLVVAEALGRLERRFSALGARLKHLVLQPRRRLDYTLLQLVGGQEGNPFLQPR